jgi:hypothetical protein
MNVKELFENEELMSIIVEDLEDIPEDSEVGYEVWALGYTADEDCTDDEVLLGEFTDPDEAVKYAEAVTLEMINEMGYDECDEDTSYFSIEVETVVEDPEDEDGGTVNIGSVYQRELWIDGEYGSEENVSPSVSLSTGEYEILKDNTVKVSCKLLKDFNKNDLVRICFPDSSMMDCQIVSKVIYADGDYYHCEMMF